MLEKLQEWFETHDDEYGEFARVEYKTSGRRDLHAFNLLDRLVPGDCDMVAAAEHDEFFLEVEPEDLAKVATEADIVELIRCGVRYDESEASLAMFA